MEEPGAYGGAGRMRGASSASTEGMPSNENRGAQNLRQLGPGEQPRGSGAMAVICSNLRATTCTIRLSSERRTGTVPRNLPHRGQDSPRASNWAGCR